MVSAGIAFVACIITALTLFALLGFRSGAWSAILLGAVGIIYSIFTYPARILIIVLPLSVLSLVLGCVTIVFEHMRRRGIRMRRTSTARDPAPPFS
jgi:hypothetical protein